MTPLTKVFVVLLVITSVMLAAADVVFVSRLQPMKTALDTANQKATAAGAARDAAISQAAAAEAAAQKEVAVAEGQRQAAAAVIANYQQQVDKLTVDLATANSNFTEQQALANRLTDTIKGANATVATYGQQIKDLRDANDKLVRQAEDDSRAIADKSSQIDTITAELKFAREQLAGAQEKAQKLGAALQDLGHSPDEVLASGTAGVSGGAPRINGVIRERQVIGGVTYVTLSVGSADGVTKGMQFNVIDPATQQFLGIVTVETLDNTDSIGRLDGPADKIAQVKRDDEVKTQLRGS